MRINDVELVPERTTYKVDGSGRVIIPSYMRQKFQISPGDTMDYYSAYVDGEWFLFIHRLGGRHDVLVIRNLAKMHAAGYRLFRHGDERSAADRVIRQKELPEDLYIVAV